MLDYVTGRLVEPLEAVVAGHITMVADARSTVEQLEAVGGCLLDSLEPAEIADDAFERTCARLEAEGAPAAIQPPRPNHDPCDTFGGRLPWPVASYLERVGTGPWQTAVPGLEIKSALKGHGNYRAHLVKAAAGHTFPPHGHVGLEATLVVEGGFKESGVTYLRGDLQVGDGEDRHQPVIDPEGCFCFVVLGGPLKLTDGLARLINPLLASY